MRIKRVNTSKVPPTPGAKTLAIYFYAVELQEPQTQGIVVAQGSHIPGSCFSIYGLVPLEQDLTTVKRNKASS